MFQKCLMQCHHHQKRRQRLMRLRLLLMRRRLHRRLDMYCPDLCRHYCLVMVRWMEYFPPQ